MIKHIHRQVRKARYIVYKETLVNYREHFWTFIGSFVGIGLIGLISSEYFTAYDNLFMVGSFGASSVLIYGVINSPLAQPRNLIGGHVLSAIVGVTMFKLFGTEIWLSSALAVSASIVVMQMTKTLHPPGGATALIANVGSAKVHALGYFYVISPVLSGAVILLIVALIFNNMTKHRHYPNNKHWYKIWRRYKRTARHQAGQ
ncbi:HPP family protein [Mucilaginibacter myungsuensis]|uniref:HPP family protein n=1 Tax=Mucilaginibacter myungsuensis TaxID=649104 RepID=A0A929KWI3_9SPHI|nr:HPP family protein [Mucilaginibacter myungsuensis]MBE9662919.1 HPP family protein [Mucilaginibacter myungsuensis]MDN3598541.1 HPP family protein [Mucilaginibacter myungsuensis]